jgi:glycosyltransferase involved in cell wall biosynthesis
MKIAVVAPTYLPSNRANTIQVMKMAQALMENGHTVRLAVPAGRPKGLTHRWGQLAHHYGLQHEFDIQWLQSARVLRGYDFGWRAINWAKEWGAQLVFTRHPQTAAFCSLSGMPTILEVHDMPHGWTAENLFKAYLKGKGASRIIVITNALAADLAKQFPVLSTNLSHRTEYAASKNTNRYLADFMLIAPDGVDLVRYTGMPAPKDARPALANLPNISGIDIKSEQFTAGYTGHLYRGRGMDLLLEMAQRLPQIAFLIAGGEPERVEELRWEANLLSLNNVHLSGFIPNADLPLVQAACDVLLMPYQERVEASSGGDIGRYLSPMKAFEYLACGRPIVVSNLPVFREVFNEMNCILVAHDDPDAWVEALLRLQNDNSLCLKLGEQARRDAQKYDWKARAARIMEGIADADVTVQ